VIQRSCLQVGEQRKYAQAKTASGKQRSNTDHWEVNVKKVLALVAVSLFLIAACGGDNTETPAALEDINAAPCLEVPVNTPSVGILGQRVPAVSDLKICTDVSASVGIVPEIQQFDDCGDPCYAVVVNDFDIAADAKITLDYKTDGQQAHWEYDPEPVNQEVGEGRICVASVGGDEDTPDPCAERLTTPKPLNASVLRKQVSLSWKRSIDTGDDNLMGYELWRSEDGVNFGQLATIGETSFTDTSVTKGTTYYYFVVAFDEDGNRSQASNTVQVTAK